MKIIILGWYYSANLGDAVICDCVAEKLRQMFPESEIMICDLDGRTRFQGFDPVPWKNLVRSRIKAVLREGATRMGIHDFVYPYYAAGFKKHREEIDKICREDADVVIFGGGQLYMDYLTLQAAECVKRFAERGIPVLFNACGTGPTLSRKLRTIYQEVLMLPEVRWISARDHAEFVKNYYLSGKREVEPVSDPGLWSGEVYCTLQQEEDGRNSSLCRETGFVKQSAEGQNKRIGLGVMYTRNLPLRTCVTFWRKLARYLDSRQIAWQFFTNGDGKDLSVVNEILKGMPEYRGKEKEMMAPSPKTPAELVRMIAAYRGIISFRLHSHIIACSTSVPAAAIVWDDKLNSFYSEIGHPERCCTVKDSPSKIWETFLQAEEEGYPAAKLDEVRQASLEKLAEQVRRCAGD